MFLSSQTYTEMAARTATAAATEVREAPHNFVSSSQVSPSGQSAWEVGAAATATVTAAALSTQLPEVPV